MQKIYIEYIKILMISRKEKINWKLPKKTEYTLNLRVRLFKSGLNHPSGMMNRKVLKISLPTISERVKKRSTIIYEKSLLPAGRFGAVAYQYAPFPFRIAPGVRYNIHRSSHTDQL